MSFEFISLGGWCGTKLALKGNGYDRASYPFDYVRSSIEGVIDCIQNNFANYFPKDLVRNQNYKTYEPFIGKYIGFYHDDLHDENTIQSFKRKINRFNEILLLAAEPPQQHREICFLRTICTENYQDELKYYKNLQEVLDTKSIKYIVIFIIPNQDVTRYYKNLDDKTFIFTLNDMSYDNSKLGIEYKYIYDFIKHHNLFAEIPAPNEYVIVERKSRLWLVDDLPMVGGC